MYYYVVEEYRVSNELLTEDVYVSVIPKGFRKADMNLTNSEPPSYGTASRRLRSSIGRQSGGVVEEEVMVE